MAKLHSNTRALGQLGVLWTAFLLAGMLLASVWDGDGNPNTENLPQATVMLHREVCAPPTSRGTGGCDGRA